VLLPPALQEIEKAKPPNQADTITSHNRIRKMKRKRL